MTIHSEQGRIARIGFIGGGNMAYAMIAGLLRQGYSPSLLSVFDPNDAALARLRELSPALTLAADADSLVHNVDACVLAVKPQVLRDVATALQMADATQPPIFISIAAGVRSADIVKWLAGTRRVIRAMPNQPALLGEGVSGLFAGAGCSKAQRELAETVLGAVGSVCWVADEAALDAVTAISGSGPAYFFLLMEMLRDAAVNFGLPEAMAQQLVTETAAGAAAMARNGDFAALRAGVTSPGGTTEAAIEHLLAHDVRNLYDDTLEAARQRASTLADQAARD